MNYSDIITTYSPPPWPAPNCRNTKVHLGTWQRNPRTDKWAVWGACHIRTRSIGAGENTLDPVNCSHCKARKKLGEAQDATNVPSQSKLDAWNYIVKAVRDLGSELGRSYRWNLSPRMREMDQRASAAFIRLRLLSIHAEPDQVSFEAFQMCVADDVAELESIIAEYRPPDLPPNPDPFDF